MDNRKILSSVLNALMKIETKGEGTLLMADSLRALAQVIQTMPEEAEKENGDKEEKKTGK